MRCRDRSSPVGGSQLLSRAPRGYPEDAEYGHLLVENGALSLDGLAQSDEVSAFQRGHPRSVRRHVLIAELSHPRQEPLSVTGHFTRTASFVPNAACVTESHRHGGPLLSLATSEMHAVRGRLRNNAVDKEALGLSLRCEHASTPSNN